jgi:hypothetical protein
VRRAKNIGGGLRKFEKGGMICEADAGLYTFMGKRREN